MAERPRPEMAPTVLVEGRHVRPAAPLREHISEAAVETTRWDYRPQSTPIGTVLAGKYRIVRLLGEGGMGAVYQASHLTLGIDVAVKVMHPQMGAAPDYVRRFRREAHALSLLQHRNVVRVLDFSEEQGSLFLVMERLQGRSMADWLHTSLLPPSLDDVGTVLGQVLDGLSAAHACGIVHRDLKPENVFLATESGGAQVVKLVDFGLAHVDDTRDAGPTLTRADIVSGTPSYMSPEQCRSLAVGPSTDIYAAGCVLTEMLQLAPPFSGNPMDVLTQQMYALPPSLTRDGAAPAVPALLERLRLKMLSKAPGARPATAQAARAALLVALSLAENAERLPGRTGGSPRGSSPPPVAQSGEAGTTAASQPAALISVHRLVATDDGVTAACLVGLQAHGFEVVPARVGSAAVMVIDMGTDTEAGLGWLAREGAGRAVIACVAEVSTERLGALIAAGVQDVAAYPIDAAALARKLRRAARRAATERSP